MPTPKAWRDGLPRLQEITRNVQKISQGLSDLHQQELEEAVRSVDADEAEALRDKLRNPDDASLRLMAEDVLRTLGFVDTFEGKLIFLSGYLKGLITTTLKAFELAGVSVDDDTDEARTV